MFGMSDDECSSCSLYEFENDGNDGIQERNKSLAWLDDSLQYEDNPIQCEFNQDGTNGIQDDASSSSQIVNPTISQCLHKHRIASYIILSWKELIVTQRVSIVRIHFTYMSSLAN